VAVRQDKDALSQLWHSKIRSVNLDQVRHIACAVLPVDFAKPARERLKSLVEVTVSKGRYVLK
jgi:hypothetical protein